jgi:hypothetical protein
VFRTHDEGGTWSMVISKMLIGFKFNRDGDVFALDSGKVVKS